MIRLFILFAVIPVIELYLLIKVGSLIGALCSPRTQFVAGFSMGFSPGFISFTTVPFTLKM